MKIEDHREVARGLFRESPDVLILFDTERHSLLDINPAGLRLTNLTRKQAQELAIWDLFECDSESGLDQLIESYRKTGYFQASSDFRLRRRGGGAVPVLITVSRIHTRPKPLGLVIAHDLTEHRRAQEAIDSFFRLSPDLVCVAREDGRIERVNPAWETALGYSLSEILESDPAEIIHPDDLEATRRIQQDSGRAEFDGLENRLRHRDGEERVVIWRGLRTGDRTYSIGRDITELRRLESLARDAEVSRHAREVAERAQKLQAGFLASIGHEIRNPLSAILETIKLLDSDPAVAGGPGHIREFVRLLGDNARQMLGVTADLLDHSRIEAGQMGIDPVRCSPIRVVEEVVASSTARASARGLILNAVLEPGVPESIGTDPVRLRQILTNLTTNAIKFTERGWVQVRLGPDPEAGRDGIRIDVTDTGIGMSPEGLSRLFEPFYRSPEAQKRGLEGTGLGLAISRRLVELLGGRIEVESMPGLGTSFRVSLPSLAITDPAPSAPTPAPPALKLRGRVMIADDFEANRQVLAHHLRREGLTVETAANGEEVVARILEGDELEPPCEMILMDMQMPCLDGYEATRRLRRAGFSGPIIALTAFDSPRDREECLSIGCNEHLTKPIDYERLIAAVGKHLAGRAGSLPDAGTSVYPGGPIALNDPPSAQHP
ncbi:MAG: ATP-binding protein [Isosphaeraceae bacterium]